MVNIHIPVWDTITTSWHKVHGTKKSVWGGILAILIIGIIFGIIEGILNYAGVPVAANIVYSISQFVISLLGFGLVYMGIKRAVDQPINYRQVYYAFDWHIILNVIFLHILYFIIFLPIVMITIGTVMLAKISVPLAILAGIFTIVVSVFVAVRLYLSMGFLLDQRINAWHAIKKSYKVTCCNVWRMIGILLIQTIIILISVIPLGIGLIWTIPFGLINYGVIYNRLKHNAA